MLLPFTSAGLTRSKESGDTELTSLRERADRARWGLSWPNWCRPSRLDNPTAVCYKHLWPGGTRRQPTWGLAPTLPATFLSTSDAMFWPALRFCPSAVAGVIDRIFGLSQAIPELTDVSEAATVEKYQAFCRLCGYDRLIRAQNSQVQAEKLLRLDRICPTPLLYWLHTLVIAAWSARCTVWGRRLMARRVSRPLWWGASYLNCQSCQSTPAKTEC
jgi:hypothetical protein